MDGETLNIKFHKLLGGVSVIRGCFRHEAYHLHASQSEARLSLNVLSPSLRERVGVMVHNLATEYQDQPMFYWSCISPAFLYRCSDVFISR